MMTESDIEFFILCGGKSSRMGRDKGLMPFLGKPMIQHVIEAVRPFGRKLSLVTSHDGYRIFGETLVADNHSGKGPLGGLEAALSAARSEFVFLLSCDSPFIRKSMIQAMLKIKHDQKIVVASGGDRIYPLFALYHRSLLIQVTEHLNRNELTMHRLIHSVPFRKADLQSFLPQSSDAFANINTPDEANQYSQKWNMPLV